MTMEDDGDGECLALSLYVFIYGTVSYLFGLKNASSCFFFFFSTIVEAEGQNVWSHEST